MNESESHGHIPAPLGSVEPHAPLLSVPSDGQLLYKISSVENLLRSIVGNYLHFNRVDSYADFPGADPHDGRQLPKDQQGNSLARFEKSPDFSAANYYDQSRARTYACCFSLENSDFIWKNYANGSEKGKVGVVFEFGRLRTMLNQTLQPGNAALKYNGNQCDQIFSVNYGIVEYVDWDTHQANVDHLQNPIRYTYLKDKERFSEEKELRISLSAMGIGQFALKDGSMMQFPSSLQLAFDFKAAIADGAIQQILYASDSDSDFLQAELHKLRIVSSKG
ncbi:hypothetical protein [Methylocaldum sp.]|uniref:hypothetical protein n=1 Tax=Methylocaldum sp. TaxID=1969727 RepID=UPI002D71550B|nr:hypothetical protein [Methylocaldum sp.]HYE36469.1 hypothetical protein [Methylocaldum sp.]